MEKQWLSSYDPGVPASIDYPLVPVHRPFLEIARCHPEIPAIIYRDTPITYSALASRVTAFARALAAEGIGTDTRVGVFLPNVPEMFVSYYAVLATGATVVMLNPVLVDREFAHMASDAGFETLIAARDLIPPLADALPDSSVTRIIAVDIEAPGGSIAANDLIDLPGIPVVDLQSMEGSASRAADIADSRASERNASPSNDDLPTPDLDPRRDTAVMIYTGGTTGLPKAVELTHYAVVANALQLGAWVGLTPGYPAIAALPFFHSYGMSTGMNAAMYHGVTSIIPSGENAPGLVDAIERHRARLLVGVPSTIEGIVEVPGIESRDLSSLECCFVGAAPTPGRVRKPFSALSSARLLEGYGLTEAVTAQSANPLHGKNKTGCIGLPFPDVEFKIVDLETATRELRPEQAGELAIKSPCLMKGYHNRPAETARTIRDGWLLTGDIAWVDNEGYFYVIDRKKEMVTTGVYKAYPAEVEAAINSHEKVKESVVVGHFDDFRGHSLKAFVVLEPGTAMTAQELTDYLKVNLSAHKVPRVIEFRDGLPKNDVGKILRKELES